MSRKKFVISLIAVMLVCLFASAFTPGGRARLHPTNTPPAVEQNVGERGTPSPTGGYTDADCVGLTVAQCSSVRQTAYAQTPQTPWVAYWVSDQLITMGPDDGYPAPIVGTPLYGYPWPPEATQEPGYPAPSN